MKLKLICHGLMLFWYRPESQPGANDHGYTILIPQGLHRESKRTHRVHELRFGVGAGAERYQSKELCYPDETTECPQKRFELRFPLHPPSERPAAKGPKDGRYNLTFYANENRAARHDNSKIAFRIEIPYPHEELPLRVAHYKADPYIEEFDVAANRLAKGTAVRAFGIRPRRIVAARVFTFQIPDGSENIDLVGQIGESIHEGRIPDGLRLHLYSQPSRLPAPGEKPNHLGMINEMLLVKKRGEDATGFDLELNPASCPVVDPDDFFPPPGLSFRDLLHLAEFNEIYRRTKGGKHADDKGKDFLFVDPAECGQGGGCYNDPCDPEVDDCP